MGLLTPRDNEYQLLASFVQEALTLLGQECNVFTPIGSVKDIGMDSIKFYDESTSALILFADDLVNNKLKGKHWSKEKGEFIEAFISIQDATRIVVGSVIDITPAFFNESAMFIVNRIEGQVNSIYLKIFLVPYRKSLDVELVPEKDTSVKVVEEGTNIIKDRPFLKR